MFQCVSNTVYVLSFLLDYFYHSIDATKEDGGHSLGRLVNDYDKNPNCKVKTIIVDGRPHLCLFSIRHIFPDEEVTYNYGDSSWPWRLRVSLLKTLSLKFNHVLYFMNVSFLYDADYLKQFCMSALCTTEP